MIDRILKAIKNKIMLLVGRAILTAVNNDGKLQKVQLSGLYKETISDVDRPQQYGLESYPKIDANTEVIFLAQGGNRDRSIAIVIGNRELRPKDLSEGDVCIYNQKGDRVWIKADGTIKVEGDNVEMLGADEAFVKGTTAKPEMDKDQSLMDELQTAITAWVPVPMDGGAALKTALAAFLALPQADYSDILSDTIKGE